MKTIGIYCPRGGVGRTMLTAHLAWYAAEQGISTLAASLDESGNLVRLLCGAAPVLMVDHHWEPMPRLAVTYSPAEAPELEALDMAVPPELLLLDVGNGVAPHDLRVDAWIVPVSDLVSLGYLYLERPLPETPGGTYLVLNRADHLSFLEPVIDKVKNIHQRRFVQAIPNSGAIRRAMEGLRCTWTRWPRAKGAIALRRWAHEALHSLGLKKTPEQPAALPPGISRTGRAPSDKARG